MFTTLGFINEALQITENASEHGEMVDHMLQLVHWVMGLLLLGWSIFLVVALFKYHESRNPKADYHGVRNHASTHLEVGVVIIEAILLLGFAFPLWMMRAEKYPTDSSVVKVRAVGEKFKWTFQYAGLDGNIGNVNPLLITAGSNPIGRNPKDPNGNDDFLSPGLLKLPKDRNVIIEIRSKDVIHNLALMPMRMAQDATPGIVSHVWFKPVKTGTWDVICGQLCGPSHAAMKGTLEVVEDADFTAWMKDNAPKPPVAPAVAKQ